VRNSSIKDDLSGSPKLDVTTTIIDVEATLPRRPQLVVTTMNYNDCMDVHTGREYMHVHAFTYR